MNELVVQAGKLTPYERKVLAEVAARTVRPGPLQVVLDAAGVPFEAALRRLKNGRSRLARRTSEAIDHAVRGAVEKSLTLGGRLAGDEPVMRVYRRLGYPVADHVDIARLPLEARDLAAERFLRAGSFLLGGEGMALGAAASLAEALPFAQVAVPTLIATDIAASTTLLGRHVVQLASVYGYSIARDPGNRAHVLGAMIPQQMSWDEGFLPAKVVAMQAAREAGDFVAKLGRSASRVGFDQALRSMAREAPQLVKLVNLVIEKLGLRASQKALGMLVPIAGGAINGALNLAFQQAGHVTGKDYFRLLTLSERYGQATVRTILEHEVERVRSEARTG